MASVLVVPSNLTPPPPTARCTRSGKCIQRTGVCRVSKRRRATHLKLGFVKASSMMEKVIRRSERIAKFQENAERADANAAMGEEAKKPSVAQPIITQFIDVTTTSYSWMYDGDERSSVFPNPQPFWRSIWKDSELHEQLTAAYERDPTCTFSEQSWTYDLRAMTQTNNSTGRVRQLKREPTVETHRQLNPLFKHVLPQEFQECTTRLIQSESNSMALGTQQRAVDLQSAEAKLILERIHQTNQWKQQNCPLPRVVGIVALENAFRARIYEWTKERIAARRDGHANEVLSFHGTRLVDPQSVLSTDGLDVRFGNMGVYYGPGVYLSEDAWFVHQNYSHRDLSTNTGKPLHTMFCVKAVVGVYKYFEEGTPRQRDMRCAPKGYDSVWAHTDTSEVMMQVIHDNNQIYTSYMIHYTVG